MTGQKQSDYQQMHARGARTRAHRALRPHHHHRPLSKRVVVGAAMLFLIAALSWMAPRLVPDTATSSPISANLSQINLKPFTSDHLLGTDYLGRDVLKQAIWGGRASLFVGISAAAAAVIFGTVWGSLSAFLGGIVDSVMMRIVDGMLSIPSIILLLAFNSLISTPALVQTFPPPVLDLLDVTPYSLGMLPVLTVIFVISATTWLEAARIARAKIVSIISQEYITAATALGAGTTRMLFKHLIPNAMAV
ncbi:MAG TPA: ABC transporter permease, partial [Chroococcales cyanobacterium]